MTARPTYVIVPGLRGAAPTHWQTWLRYRLEDRDETVVCVPPSDAENIDLDERVRLVDDAVRSITGDIVLVAHSAGVITTVHWAARHPGAARHVVGALLATPPDLVSPLGPEHPSLDSLRVSGWTPIPQQTLPFASIVATSSTDEIGDLAAVTALARAWGSHVEALGAVGHLNPASGFGPWPHAEVLLEKLASRSLTDTQVAS